MKHEKWLSCLMGMLLAFGIGLAGAGCLVSAFSLEADMAAVALICAVCAAASAVCFTLRRGSLVLLAGGALLIGYILREGTVQLHIEALLNRISTFYDMAYGWGAVWWSGRSLAEVPVTGALGILSGSVAVCAAWTLCCRKNAFLAAVLGFLPLAACFVVTDTVPQEGWLFLLILGLALMLMTNPVRRRDAGDGLRLTAMLLIPALLASMLLFWLNPRQGYQSRVESMQAQMLRWISGLPFVVTTPNGDITISIDGNAGDQVDLTRVGPKTLRRYAVMDVVAPKSGLLYLRGQSLDVYDGTSWNASPVSTGKDMYFPSENLERAGWLRVSMRMPQSRRYIPYYISDYALTEGAIANDGQLQEYQYMVLDFLPGNHLPTSITVDKLRPILYQCLELPDSTRKAAEEILDEIFAASATPVPIDALAYDDTAVRAEQIRDYVRDSAAYSLNTPQMPAGEKDFALWFLTQSDTGYCVHFASALTVLLRAADIPARYVTGYTFEAEGLTKTVVRAASAHAWVEYLDPDDGWTVIDATPSEWMEEPETGSTEPKDTQPEDTESTEPTTQPEPTLDATQPTDPESTTQATEPNGGAEPGDKTDAYTPWARAMMRVILWVAGIAALIGGQYWLRRGLRRKRMRSGRRNQRALAYWQEVKRMARLTGQMPPTELEALAEKAKFSQHTLTAAELLEFDLWLKQAGSVLQKRPWIVRVAIKLVWAIE